MSGQALALWREKLSFLEVESAKASDPAQKFTLGQQIEEARAKIAELEGEPASRLSEPAPHPPEEAGERAPTSPATPWYKDYHWVVPIVVALLGLVGTLFTVWKGKDKDEPPPVFDLRFTASPTSAPADGATLSSFTVELSPVPADAKVVFSTTAGAFLPGASEISVPVVGASATADLTSPAMIGRARVIATAQNVSRERVVEFQRALPDRITVWTDRELTAPFSMEGVKVVGRCLRKVGIVTPGTFVTFRATTDTSAPIGVFRDITTVEPNGQATATFIPGRTAYRGRVTLTVAVEGRAEGSEIPGTTTIEIVDPNP